VANIRASGDDGIKRETQRERTGCTGISIGNLILKAVGVRVKC